LGIAIPCAARQPALLTQCVFKRHSGLQITVARRGVALLGGGGISSRAVPTRGPDGRPFTAITTAKLSKTPAMYPRAAPKTRPL
jgi:hypothetical protein